MDDSTVRRRSKKKTALRYIGTICKIYRAQLIFHGGEVRSVSTWNLRVLVGNGQRMDFLRQRGGRGIYTVKDGVALHQKTGFLGRRDQRGDCRQFGQSVGNTRELTVQRREGGLRKRRCGTSEDRFSTAARRTGRLLAIRSVIGNNRVWTVQRRGDDRRRRIRRCGTSVGEFSTAAR